MHKKSDSASSAESDATAWRVREDWLIGILTAFDLL